MIKPILFNTEMVRAIQNGTKTVTRRVVKGYALEHLELDTDGSIIGVYNQLEGRVFPLMDYAPYHPGDILYVREAWEEWPDLFGEFPGYIYRADYSDEALKMGDSTEEVGSDFPACVKWHPSIHMPREAARIFLRVTEVRVERLQNAFSAPISPIFELQKEGIDIGDTCRERIENYGEPCCVDTVDNDGANLYGGECGILDEVRGDFSDLWDSIIKPADRALYGWDANPWVWGIEFERISREEAMENA